MTLATHLATFEGWAVVSPPNPRSKRRYIDHSSVSYQRKSSIAAHCQWMNGDPKENWARQRKKGWTVERVRMEVAS